MVKDYIEYIGIIILRCALNTLNIFPIKDNRIIFYCFNGKQYSCNPRRISDFLGTSKDQNNYELIWAFKQPQKFKNKLPNKVKVTKYRSLQYYYYAKTSKIVVFNVQGYGELSKRKGQTFIQTWHASNGYKKVGVHLKGIKRKVNLLGHRDYSYVMCGSHNMENNRVRKSMGFQGEIIKGTPRMDSIINQDLIGIDTKVRSWLQVDSTKKIVLYAPTWRDDRYESNYGIDYAKVKESFDMRFGGDWVIAVRLHPNVYTKVEVKFPYVIDTTEYPDMEELIYVVDAMISDYSSCIWDFSFTYRPCFLLCTDLFDYDASRSFDMPIDTWGFPLSTSSLELCEKIITFDNDNYLESIKRHHIEMGSYEDGHATERVCALIKSIVNS